MDELIGVWDSAPYAYGAMEAERLILLADGTGWTEWANALAGSFTRITWRRLGPDSFEIKEQTLFSGTWENPVSLRLEDEPMSLDDVQEVTYALSHEIPPLSDAVARTLRVNPSVQFSRAFAYVTAAAPPPQIVPAPTPDTGGRVA